MSNEVAIILVSHGYYAKSAMESAEMIAGKQSNYAVVAVIPGKNLNDITKEISEEYEKLNRENGVVILCDIFGGTPSNACAAVLIESQEKDNIIAFTGFNLQILIEILMNRKCDLKELNDIIKNEFPESWSCLNDKLLN
ncbi:PTS system fructose subfamily IIA component [Clostridium sp. DL-VIII]|uniref:PTS sugar transporter subunit IIA n=1 Tax=Clostridium sp. DL-VIII TaxID=641107 RepID=UPI00023B016E|nr:PTS sugar transporter subunit IIA [Clostridium sp. DL-VIII]EHI99228.1 PTS system fructose subfamily IIA component [Clostridium sp. DL-VIII]